MQIEIFEIDGGFGFQIVNNGMVVIYQPTDETPGNEPMTRERAEQFAAEMLQRLTG